MKRTNKDSYELLQHNLRYSFISFFKGLVSFLIIVVMGLSFFFILLPRFNENNQTNFNIPVILVFSFILIFLIMFSIATSISLRIETSYTLPFLIKRLIDIVISSLVIFLLSPIMLTVTLLVLVDSKGPVIYRSIRIGQNGKPFDRYKFRTMKVGNEDYHITRLGRFLRRYSLDELPSFYNVLIGEMSIIGPRPRFYDEVNKDFVEYESVLKFKPGITGSSQVSLSKMTSYEDIIKYDLEYVMNWSLLLDLKILFKTFTLVLSNKKNK